MLLKIAAFAVTFYIALLAVLFLFQRRLIYHPVQTLGLEALENAPNAKLIALTTQDKTAIAAWHIPTENPSLPLIVYFHGNAGHIGERIEKLNHYVRAGFGILAVSYRGFGNSQGFPTETGLYDDAMTTVQNAIEALNIPPNRLLLMGESLGTGVATHTAKALADQGNPVFALVLEAPYTSVANRSQELYPYIPALYMVRDKFLSIDKIKHVKCPLLIFHGESDAVIPVHHGRALLEAALEPKHGIFFPKVGHTDFDAETLAKELKTFVEAHTRTSEG